MEARKGSDHRTEERVGGRGRTIPTISILTIARRLEVFLQKDTGFVRYGSDDGIVLSSRSNPAHELPYGARVADLKRDGLTDLVYFVGRWYRESSNFHWIGNWHWTCWITEV